VVWFVRFVIVSTVPGLETDAKSHFRKEKEQNLLDFHRFQMETFE